LKKLRSSKPKALNPKPNTNKLAESFLLLCPKNLHLGCEKIIDRHWKPKMKKKKKKMMMLWVMMLSVFPALVGLC